MLNALAIYSNIEIDKKMKEAGKPPVYQTFATFRAKDAETELKTNPDLVAITTGNEENEAGSDSAPSEDNLAQEELA